MLQWGKCVNAGMRECVNSSIKFLFSEALGAEALRGETLGREALTSEGLTI